MNDFDINGAEINGSSEVYIDSGAASFYFAVGVNAQKAILGNGSASVVNSTGLAPQTRKFLSGNVSFNLTTGSIPPQVRKYLSGGTQFNASVSGEIKRIANAGGSIQTIFYSESDSTISGPVRSTMSIVFAAAADTMVRPTVLAESKPNYIETRSFITEIKNPAIHNSASVEIELFGNAFLNLKHYSSGVSFGEFHADGDSRIGGKPQGEGCADISLYSSVTSSLRRYVLSGGYACISCTCKWSLDSKPVSDFGFIRAKPDRIIKVPMDNRRIIIPMGAL